MRIGRYWINKQITIAMSKIVITSTGNSVLSEMDKRFGRASWFCLYDDENQSMTFHKNENEHANHGAGTQAAQKMVEWQVKKIISGDFGPKAKDLLDKFNIQLVVIQDNGLTVQDILDKMQKK